MLAVCCSGAGGGAGGGWSCGSPWDSPGLQSGPVRRGQSVLALRLCIGILMFWSDVRPGQVWLTSPPEQILQILERNRGVSCCCCDGRQGQYLHKDLVMLAFMIVPLLHRE